MKSFTEYIANQFSNPTGFGGILSTWFMNNLNRKQYKAVLKNVSNSAIDENVLDIGFGNGMLIKKLTKRSDAHFYGIDISEDMIEAATRRNSKKVKEKKVTLMQADVNELPFENNFFDKIYTVNTVYFWKDLKSGFTEIERVLKPDGVFLNIGYTKQWLDKLRYTNYGFSKYQIAELEEAAKSTGLIIEDMSELKKGSSYCLTVRKKAKF